MTPLATLSTANLSTLFEAARSGRLTCSTRSTHSSRPTALIPSKPTYWQRLEKAVQLAQGLRLGASVLLNDPGEEACFAIPNIKRHRTFYALSERDFPTVDNAALTVEVAYDANARRYMLALTFKEGFDRLAFKLSEPIGEDGFNALAPKAPAADLLPIPARWRDWMDRIVLPIQCDGRSPMEDHLRTSISAILKLLRGSGYEPQTDFFDSFTFRLSQPFRLPQVTCKRDDVLPRTSLHPCFTEAGQAMLANVLPTILDLDNGRTSIGYEFSVRAHMIEEEEMGQPMGLLEAMRAIGSLPGSDQPGLTVPPGPHLTQKPAP